MFDLVLRNEPWQWTYRPGTEISYLLDPNSGMYKDYKIRIEKAVISFTTQFLSLKYLLAKKRCPIYDNIHIGSGHVLINREE